MLSFFDIKKQYSFPKILYINTGTIKEMNYYDELRDNKFD